MKNSILFIAFSILIMACGGEKKQRGRIDYDLIKEKAGITGELSKEFDKITADFGKQMSELHDKNKANNVQTTDEERAAITQSQDEKIKKILSAEQYAIYDEEIKIERSGREKHNISLIREALEMDSTQTAGYDQAQAVFYKTLRDNHDSYHGKPEVYQQFYTELDESRKAALKALLSEEQFNKYLQLADQYNLGKKKK